MSRIFSSIFAIAWTAAIIGLIYCIAAFFRFEIAAKSDGNIARLDRWTGELQFCDSTACVKPSLISKTAKGTVLQFPQDTEYDIITKTTVKVDREEAKDATAKQ